ncbi:MAG: type II toxin-antitoxin system HicB family antitoxin [Deltaproteobacteria bacterium]|nr:type II toxin-antitoxin system HicB family antitoxin [Deltaproteobacteria bacterium]
MKTTILHFAIDVLPEEDGKGYYVIVPSLPGCFSQGRTVEQAITNAQEAIALHIRALRRHGDPIPRQERTVHTVIEIAA